MRQLPKGVQEAIEKDQFLKVLKSFSKCQRLYNANGLAQIHLAALCNSAQSVKILLKQEFSLLTRQKLPLKARNLHNEFIVLPAGAHAVQIALVCKNKKIVDILIDYALKYKETAILGDFPSRNRTFYLLFSLDDDFGYLLNSAFLDQEILANYKSQQNAAILACKYERIPLLLKLIELSQHQFYQHNIYEMFLIEDENGRIPLQLLDDSFVLIADVQRVTQQAEAYFAQVENRIQSSDTLGHYCIRRENEYFSDSDIGKIKQIVSHSRTVSGLQVSRYVCEKSEYAE